MELRGSLLFPWTWDQTFQALQVGLPPTAAVVLPFWELAVADAFLVGSGHQSLRKVEGKGSWICKCSCVFNHCWSWSSRLLLYWRQLARHWPGAPERGSGASAPPGWESSRFCTLQSSSLCNACEVTEWESVCRKMKRLYLKTSLA